MADWSTMANEDLAPGVTATGGETMLDPDFPVVLYHPDGRAMLVHTAEALEEALAADAAWVDSPARFGQETAPDETSLARRPQLRYLGQTLEPTKDGVKDMGALVFVLQGFETRLAQMEKAVKDLGDLLASNDMKLAGYLGAVDGLKHEVSTLQAWVVEQTTATQRKELRR